MNTSSIIKSARRLHLSQEFRACVHGDKSIHDYFRQLQHLASALADIDDAVDDSTLTLQMIHGLGDKFAMQATIL